MKTKIITKEEYMSDSSNLHDSYFLQFATEGTRIYVLASLEIEDIKKAMQGGDLHLNKIKIPYSNMGRGMGWWWDAAPVNTKLLKDLGESNSPATHTCVAKALARSLAK